MCHLKCIHVNFLHFYFLGGTLPNQYNSSANNCLLLRRLSLVENVRAKERFITCRSPLPCEKEAPEEAVVKPFSQILPLTPINFIPVTLNQKYMFWWNLDQNLNVASCLEPQLQVKIENMGLKIKTSVVLNWRKIN